MGLPRPFVECNCVGVDMYTNAGLGDVATALEDYPYDFDAEKQQIQFEYTFDRDSWERYDSPTPSKLNDDVEPNDVIRVSVDVSAVEDMYYFEYYTSDIRNPDTLSKLFHGTKPEQVARKKSIGGFGYYDIYSPHPLLTIDEVVKLLNKHDDFEGNEYEGDTDLTTFSFRGYDYVLTDYGELALVDNGESMSQKELDVLFDWLNEVVIEMLPDPISELEIESLPEWWGGSVTFTENAEIYADIISMDMETVFTTDDTYEKWELTKELIDSITGIESDDFHVFGEAYFDLIETIAFGLNYADSECKNKFFDRYADTMTVFGDVTSPSDPSVENIPNDVNGALFDMEQIQTVSSVAVDLLHSIYQEENKIEAETGDKVECWLVPEAIKFEAEVERLRTFLPGYYCPIKPLKYGVVTDFTLYEEKLREMDDVEVLENGNRRLILSIDGLVLDFYIGDIEPLLASRIVD